MFASFNSSLRRDCQPELMDQPGLGWTEHSAALRGLGRINFLSRASLALWHPIVALAREMSGARRPVRVLDLATGGGDSPIALARRAARSSLPVEIEGCDINSQAVSYAQEQAEARGVRVRFFVLDALKEPLPEEFDVLCCSLFLHHLDEHNALALLRRMAGATRQIVLIDDLIRSRRGYLLALIGTRLLSRSRIVHVDGLLSVRSAFTLAEARLLAEHAGLRGARVRRHWPERFLLSWRSA
jgi:2-polyprenyl-3-methyl-5-hydroxy-6-metoxy-1,4-benzoquinol methylase